jgi:SagB-type dehydrogenase family enzyme
MYRLRQDLDHLTSVGLLAAALVTAATGLIADLWDLNDFWYHTLAGYVMGALAIAHVAFNWRTLVGYARFRLTRRRGRAVTGRMPAPVPNVSTRRSGSLISRRGLIGAAVAGAAGVALGRGLRAAPPIPAGSDVGVIYHEWSKPGIVDALGSVANWGQSVPLYKHYPGAPLIHLDHGDVGAGMSASEAMLKRRSVRSFSDHPMSAAQLSHLLRLASGISSDKFGNARRTAPSSGALYPVELYPVIHNVEGFERGVYHYAYLDHAVELIRAGDFRQRIVEQALMQDFLGQTGAVIFLTQILQRMRPKYQDRSYRYGLVEIGHIGQNLYLAATSMGLGACGVGAFMDDDINDMLGVDGTEEAAIYLVAVGRPMLS